MSADPYAGGVRRTFRPRLPAAWWPALRRTPVSLWNDDITDYAAALTYYAILAVLPAMMVTVLAFGLISPDTAEEFVTHVTMYAPAESGADLHAVLSRALGADRGRGRCWWPERRARCGRPPAISPSSAAPCTTCTGPRTGAHPGARRPASC